MTDIDKCPECGTHCTTRAREYHRPHVVVTCRQCHRQWRDEEGPDDL